MNEKKNNQNVVATRGASVPKPSGEITTLGSSVPKPSPQVVAETKPQTDSSQKTGG